MVQYKCKGRKPEMPQGVSIKAVYSTVTTYPYRKREIERSHIEGRGEGGGAHGNHGSINFSDFRRNADDICRQQQKKVTA
jgi:hypothetical protein